MTARISERSLYAPIINLFKKVASEYEVEVGGVSEVKIGDRYPDVLIHLNEHKILVQVKIGGFSRLIEDIVKSYPIAKQHDSELFGILFPSEVRRIRPVELEKVVPRLPVSRALVLAEWFSGDFENVGLIHVIESIIKEFVEFKRTRIPAVSYLTIAKVSRETIEELASALRRSMGVEKYFSMAQAIVGRFDFYRSLLEDFVEEEEVMKTYIADIIAYLAVLQLLFAHIVSVKRFGETVLPSIRNPLTIPGTLIEDIKENVQTLGIVDMYMSIIGSLPYLLEILGELSRRDSSVLMALGRYIYSIRVLRPEHVKEELLGRIYQEGLPPETRKNLGAFFTNPRAAKLLAELAIEYWDESVLDPACGSGTLLVSAYWAKMRRSEEQGVNLDRDSLHELFLVEHVKGIDVMQFAKDLTTINLALQDIGKSDVKPNVFCGDGISKMVHVTTVKEDDTPSSSLLDYIKIVTKEYKELSLPREGFDLVIMNPPFTKRERIPENERRKLERLLKSIVKGKVGYWAYFFVAADNMIKPGGKLAAVTPEEFFVGGGAESVRRHLLLEKKYRPKYIIKSSVEPAFSEQAKYRDYLLVSYKMGDFKDVIVAVLKRRLHDECDERCIDSIITAIKNFENSDEREYSDELVDAWKVDLDVYLEAYGTENLKPLVAPYTLEFKRVVTTLINVFRSLPTLRDYIDEMIIKAGYYNPGQYKARGVESYARSLIIPWHYKKITGKAPLRILKVEGDNVQVGIRVKERIEETIELPKRIFIPAFRSYSNVNHMDITNEEDLAISCVDEGLLKMLGKAGITDPPRILSAIKDITSAYNDLAGNIMLLRKFQIPSPGLYWLAFLSENKVLGTTDYINVKLNKLTLDEAKILVLYLNSVFTIAQVLSLREETRGGWGRFDLIGMWDRIHIPDMVSLPSSLVEEGLNLYEEIKKKAVKPIDERLKSMSEEQVNIDLYISKILNLNLTQNDLKEIYNAILKEMNILIRIMKAYSEDDKKKQKARSKKEAKTKKGALKYRTLDDFIEKEG